LPSGLSATTYSFTRTIPFLPDKVTHNPTLAARCLRSFTSSSFLLRLPPSVLPMHILFA
jgi:hypothetical protein